MASTEVTTITKGSFLALNHTTAELREVLAENMGEEPLTERDLPRLEIVHAIPQWRVGTPTGDEHVDTVRGILIMYRRTRAYWEDHNPSGQPPSCKSPTARRGYGTPGGECRSCPLSKFGSHPDAGSNAQACSESEIWFLLREGSFLPAVLKMPPSSLNAAKDYRVKTLGNFGIKLPSVLTEVGLTPMTQGGNKYGVAAPRLAGMLTQEEAGLAMAYAQEFRPQLEAAADGMAEEQGEERAPAQSTPEQAAKAKAATAGTEGVGT